LAPSLRRLKVDHIGGLSFDEFCQCLLRLALLAGNDWSSLGNNSGEAHAAAAAKHSTNDMAAGGAEVGAWVSVAARERALALRGAGCAA
jgi:hypothetical protein